MNFLELLTIAMVLQSDHLRSSEVISEATTATFTKLERLTSHQDRGSLHNELNSVKTDGHPSNDITNEHNEIFQVIAQRNNSKETESGCAILKYEIDWKSDNFDSRYQHLSLPGLFAPTKNEAALHLAAWGKYQQNKKTFIILIGDSNERNVLQSSPAHFNCSSFPSMLSQQFCCDLEEKDIINVTFCNIFIFGIDAKVTNDIFSVYGNHLKDNHEVITYMNRTQESLKTWNAQYDVDISEKCASNQWNCHVMFESFLWDITKNMSKIQLYEQRLAKFYHYIKYDGFKFVNTNIIWRDAPLPAKWARRNIIHQLNAYNQIGYNLFRQNVKNNEMSIFKWSNFVPLADAGDHDDHHWLCIYNDLFLALMYRLTTIT
eukprot:208559_1